MTAPVLGPQAKAAARLPSGGGKRHKVLVLIAAFLDAGVEDPPIRVLAQRTRIPAALVCEIVDALEAVGLLEITRGVKARGERNRYRIKGQR
jgi:hypothetical protein